MRSLTHVTLSLALASSALLISCLAAEGRSVKVPQSVYEKLDAKQQAELADQMRDIGVIGSSDTLEPERTDRRFPPLIAGKIGMLAGGMICKYVVDADREERFAACAKRTPAEARKDCENKVKASADGVGKLCDLIQLKF